MASDGTDDSGERGGNPPAVELDAVTRKYAGTAAVDGVSLSIEEGEFFTLVGPSGCGKTTTLRLIAGFEPATAGTIRLGGTDVADVAPENRGVGVVFQSYALFPHMSVGENVGYGLRFVDVPGGVTKAERIAELLELVDLAGMEDRSPEQLSGGQQQRVAIARALAPEPDVLLLDEPMSALDARLRERLRVQVKAIQDALGITTIYVTHDQEEALAISDRVAVMRAGRIEQVGTPRAVYRRPETPFVARFVGDNNVLTGAVEAVRESDGTPVADVRVGQTTLAVGANADTAVDVGDRLTFCVRPEALVVGDGRNAMRATVESTEFLGDRTRSHLDWHGRNLLVRSHEPLTGDVTVGFDPEDAHVVDVS